MSVAAPDYVRELVGRWRPPPRLGGAEWAEAERWLGQDESPNRPGKMRLVRWQREILDALADPQLDWVVILKAAQVSGSELVRCAIGRWARLDPGDVLWVMATERAAEKAMRKLQAMFRNTPSLRGLLSDRRTDTTLYELVLTNGMRIVIGWAGSPQSLASDPFRYVILDETGLYPARVGSEGSPIGLAEERTKTFGRRAKVVLLSKPAHAEDLICTAYDECLDKRAYAVPCPSCRTLQPLEWDRVRWPGGEPATAPTDARARLELAARVETEQSAWISCASCDGAITDTHSAMADEASWWVQSGEGTETVSRRRAFHVSELYHWVKTTSDLVARFLRALKPGDVQNFWTGSLGLPLRTDRSEIRPELFARRAVHPPGLVPSWATAVLATADTQIDHYWFMVRAWGEGQRSRLLAFGRAETLEALVEETLARAYPLDGGGRPVRPQLLLIDSGGGTAGGALDRSRSAEIYEFASRVPGVVALKGMGELPSTEGVPIRWRTTGLGARGDDQATIELCQPNTNWFKDTLAKLVRSEAPVLWEESIAAADPNYGRQMTGQALVLETDTKGRERWLWKKRRGRADHLWDCAAYQVVAAEIARVEDGEPLTSVVRRQAEEHEDDEEEPWFDGAGWMDR